MRKRRDSEVGFTFIEVVIALALFAAGAALIVGLESSAINRTVRDRNAQQAMLAARRIMALIETAGPKLEIGDQEDQPVEEILQTLGAPPAAADNEQKEPTLEGFRASLLFKDWDLPFENIQNPAMKKVALIVAWGDGDGERLVIDYLFPLPPQ